MHALLGQPELLEVAHPEVGLGAADVLGTDRVIEDRLRPAGTESGPSLFIEVMVVGLWFALARMIEETARHCGNLDLLP